MQDLRDHIVDTAAKARRMGGHMHVWPHMSLIPLIRECLMRTAAPCMHLQLVVISMHHWLRESILAMLWGVRVEHGSEAFNIVWLCPREGIHPPPRFKNFKEPNRFVCGTLQLQMNKMAESASADTKSHTTEVGHRFDQMQEIMIKCVWTSNGGNAKKYARPRDIAPICKGLHRRMKSSRFEADKYLDLAESKETETTIMHKQRDQVTRNNEDMLEVSEAFGPWLLVSVSRESSGMFLFIRVARRVWGLVCSPEAQTLWISKAYDSESFSVRCSAPLLPCETLRIRSRAYSAAWRQSRREIMKVLLHGDLNLVLIGLV
eukprot:6474680-Amphidinium_carterae.1